MTFHWYTPLLIAAAVFCFLHALSCAVCLTREIRDDDFDEAALSIVGGIASLGFCATALCIIFGWGV